MLRIGTSGWIYKHWRGVFYPERLPQRAWLEFYAQHFDTVEVNFSFYRLPSRETFEAWQRRAPEGFCYAVKGSRFITHLKRLQEPEQHVALFFERLQGLGERAGPVLWQLPPDFRRDNERLERFLAALPSGHQHALEFRHESWLSEPIFERLAGRGAALVIPESPHLPRALRLTTNWTYLRFHEGAHGGSYTAQQLDTWADWIRSVQAGGATVWAYFNNDVSGYAVKNARALRTRLEGDSR